ncbi:glycosyltransferase family 4 protein [Egbenema bharatensis]|uniref:glycosyltransferase family 4 protein n=1 Tax=Egbenema bharatensis TaxID=3463334 RepID=UPI003A84E9E1
MITHSPIPSQPHSLLQIALGWFPTSPGGIERYVYELTHHLAASGDTVELCGIGLPAPPPDLPFHLTNLASPTDPIERRLWSARSYFAQRQLLQPDAINLHFALYSFPLMQVLPDDVPLTFTFHGPWAMESQQEGTSKISAFVKQWMEQRVYRQCDRFIVLSQAFGEILHQSYKVPWERIHSIPGGVDTARFQLNLNRQQARAQLDLPSDRFILFTPRRLVQRMGIDRLLLALSQIRSRIPDVFLAIAGKGAMRSSLEQQVNELGLQNHVRFFGFLPDEQLPIAYQAADLTVIPSQALEGFGLVLVESLACGTPVLCTPIGGMPEILHPFAPDLITTSTDAESIAHHLQSILTERIPLPARTDCQTYAHTHFNWQTIAPQVRSVLLGEKSY